MLGWGGEKGRFYALRTWKELSKQETVEKKEIEADLEMEGNFNGKFLFSWPSDILRNRFKNSLGDELYKCSHITGRAF